VWVRTTGAAPNRKVVVGWVDVPHYSHPGTVSVQLVLRENDGGVVFRYRDTEFGDPTLDRGASATAGIENASGTRGRQLVANVPGLASRTAYRCSNEPRSLTVRTPNGT
jgi:hypothetical protein